jgi:ubiquinone/menaquinone biosynthesis C-methylase UbiE
MEQLLFSPPRQSQNLVQPIMGQFRTRRPATWRAWRWRWHLCTIPDEMIPDEFETMRTEDIMTDDVSWAGSMPEFYDRMMGPALFEPYARYVADRAAAIAPARVLELAAGTGIVTAELVRALPHAEITATDLNPAMVDWGNTHVPGATWRQADAQQLGFADGSFDLVVCQFGVMFFPDKRAAYGEAARVMAPGGSLLYLSWDAIESCDVDAAVAESVHAIFPDEPTTFLERVPHGYHDAAVLRVDAESAGFVDVHVKRMVLRGAAESARAVANGFGFGSPLRFELEKLGELDELVARLADELITRLGDGPITGELSAYVITGRKAP